MGNGSSPGVVVVGAGVSTGGDVATGAGNVVVPGGWTGFRPFGAVPPDPPRDAEIPLVGVTKVPPAGEPSVLLLELGGRSHGPVAGSTPRSSDPPDVTV